MAYILALLLTIILGGGTPATAAFTPNAPDVPALASSTQNSYNWAGYVASGKTYTDVSGSWRVPKVTESGAALAADATWVGVGGVLDEDLIQAGTQAVEQNGHLQYQAWVETLPGGASREIPLRVSAGDRVSVELSQVDAAHWELSFENSTTGKSYHETIPFYSSGSSAEWVEEMPSLGEAGHFIPLDNFDQAVFSAGSTTVDGKELSIADSGAEPLSMVTRRGTSLAAPSVIENGGFVVTRAADVPLAEVTQYRPSRFQIFVFSL